MNRIEQLKGYGLFDAKVPRYTSYPPANHFSPTAGRQHQATWLAAVPQGKDISLYLHIPFCRRLCWFCACRTQGTQSLRPVDDYVGRLIAEVDLVADRLPDGQTLSRLHLGGGTPTLLSPETMAALLDKIFARFARGSEFEFSVEIDPTEAAEPLLAALADYGMNRASIGVQDFDEKVQKAIGREQSAELTRQVVDTLRLFGVGSLNMDLLYGLPFQSGRSLDMTLQKVIEMRPDRLALYGYAHVPWMSKRQVMIDSATLPSPQSRYELSQLARAVLVRAGYDAIGIDHFALPTDSLAIAAANGTLRRNFQGYTDDTSDTLVGLGASAISKFPEGYSQNASATSAYVERIEAGELAGTRGYAFTGNDLLRSVMIEQILCDFRTDTEALLARFPDAKPEIDACAQRVSESFPDLCALDGNGVVLSPEAYPLSRVIAGVLDEFVSTGQAHSQAV